MREFSFGCNVSLLFWIIIVPRYKKPCCVSWKDWLIRSSVLAVTSPGGRLHQDNNFTHIFFFKYLHLLNLPHVGQLWQVAEYNKKDHEEEKNCNFFLHSPEPYNVAPHCAWYQKNILTTVCSNRNQTHETCQSYPIWR